MRIGVDFESVFDRATGIGMFARHLVEAVTAETKDIEFILYRSNRSRDLNTLERVFWESIQIPFRCVRTRPDLLYVPGFAPPVLSPVRSVVTVHDLIGMIYPNNQRAISGLYWNRWLPSALKKGSRLVASSEATRRDIETYLKISAKRIPVVPLWAHSRFQKITDESTIKATVSRFGIRAPYFFCVGSLEPRKNLMRLLQAFKSLWREHRVDVELVIAGKDAASAPQIRRFISEESMEGRAHLLGYVSDEDLVRLYNGSLGYVAISLYEGFGLPALEAMSCGKSGVASNRSSLPEVTGDSALQVDPENVHAITEALRLFTENNGIRKELETRAYVRSKQFSSRTAASQMIRIFKEAKGV
jgi:glycosyltransferase involved in cell wall biosynthesis